MKCKIDLYKRHVFFLLFLFVIEAKRTVPVSHQEDKEGTRAEVQPLFFPSTIYDNNINCSLTLYEVCAFLDR